MAELTPLDEKLAEVLGLAQAAQQTVDTAAKMEGAEDFEADLTRMGSEAADTEKRTDALIDGLEGRKTAIREKARETKGEAAEMMKTYLSGDDVDGLDGFEFLVMAEAGELGHWEIVRVMNEQVGDAAIRELSEFAIPLQERHLSDAREWSLRLAREEVASG